MTTTRKLLTRALRRGGIVGSNDTPTASEINDTLEAFNDMLESWANESLMVFARTEESFPLTGSQSYTVGVGGDFDTKPFVDIVSMYARQANTDYPVTSITDTDYANITSKSTQGSPQYYNYNNGFPLAKLKLHPVPSASYTLHVVSEKQLDEYSLDDEIVLPAGWKRALITNLIIEVAGEFGVEVSNDIARVAVESKAAIKRQVSKAKTLDYPTNPNTGNIYTGWWK